MESSELRLFADLIGEKIVTALPAAIAAGIARADAERADATEAARMAGLKEMRANTDASFKIASEAENRARAETQAREKAARAEADQLTRARADMAARRAAGEEAVAHGFPVSLPPLPEPVAEPEIDIETN